MTTAGGCGGGSSSQGSAVTLGVYGGAAGLPERTRTLMEAAGMEIVSLDSNLHLVDSSGDSTGRYPDVLLLIGEDEDAGTAGIGSDDIAALPVRTAVKTVYNVDDEAASTSGYVLLLNPTEAMMDTLSTQVGESFDVSMSGDAKLLFYGRTQVNGIVSVLAHIDSSTVGSVYSRDVAEECASDDLVDLSTFVSPDVREKLGSWRRATERIGISPRLPTGMPPRPSTGIPRRARTARTCSRGRRPMWRP
jgi:hypothetical protein